MGAVKRSGLTYEQRVENAKARQEIERVKQTALHRQRAIERAEKYKNMTPEERKEYNDAMTTFAAFMGMGLSSDRNIF